MTIYGILGGDRGPDLVLAYWAAPSKSCFLCKYKLDNLEIFSYSVLSWSVKKYLKDSACFITCFDLG